MHRSLLFQANKWCNEGIVHWNSGSKTWWSKHRIQVEWLHSKAINSFSTHSNPFVRPRRTPLSGEGSGAYHAYNSEQTRTRKHFIPNSLQASVSHATCISDEQGNSPYNIEVQRPIPDTFSSSHLQHNDGLYHRLSCHQHLQDATCKLSIHTLNAYTVRIQQACSPPQHIEIWWFIKLGSSFFYQVYHVCRCIALDNSKTSRPIVRMLRWESEWPVHKYNQQEPGYRLLWSCL